MIVTKGWLEEFIDLSDITTEKLCQVFNSIGLEVDSLKEIKFPDKVVVGEVLRCEKHPEADRLNVCQVHIGNGDVKQIVCGAGNVVDARFVIVALEGAVLPEIDMTIEAVKLRGVDSFGMICATGELGLPKIEDGIAILDSSIGKLVAGKELNEYKTLCDSVIEIELTANRGDCLSVYGVARDLSAYFNRPLKSFEYKPKKFMVQGIARTLSVRSTGTFKNSKLLFNIIEVGNIKASFLTKFRVALIGKYVSDDLEVNLRCVIHSTGVILRAYDFDRLKRGGKRVSIELNSNNGEIVEVKSDGDTISYVGIYSNNFFLATQKSKKILLEASYTTPDAILKAVHRDSFDLDDFYYLTSRGTNSDLNIGFLALYKCCDQFSSCLYGELPIRIEGTFTKKVVNVDIKKLNSIIGMSVDRKRINSILNRLGFRTHGSNSQDVFGAVVPAWRHDIENVQDVAEEIMRVVGIDTIPPKPLSLIETNRLNPTIAKYRAVRDLRDRAIGRDFFEAITYIFSDKSKVKKYRFEMVEDELDVSNPIVDDLNTLRPTIVINLLEAVSKNVSYGKKKVSLFEVGAVFDREREEILKFSIVESGFSQESTILNRAKPQKVKFATFAQKLSAIVGEFEIKNSTPKESLFHPYQYGRVFVDGKDIGFIAKIHPKAEEYFDIGETFVAEMNLNDILPKHKNISTISNFQGVYKDLSLLIPKSSTYSSLSNALKSYKNSLMKHYFIIDLYEDSSLGDNRSVTIRFFLQSDDGTLSDGVIDESMQGILDYLQKSCGVKLR